MAMMNDVELLQVKLFHTINYFRELINKYSLAFIIFNCSPYTHTNSVFSYIFLNMSKCLTLDLTVQCMSEFNVLNNVT